jgi:NAD(P)-dependent dehydrogenase (short-subunit alcohol dehydrogenase family)
MFKYNHLFGVFMVGRITMGDIQGLQGKVAFITGGAGLLGPAHARALAARGAHIVLADLLGDKAAAEAARIAQEYGSTGVQCMGVQIDLTKPGSVKEAVALAIQRFAKIDILVNNAQGVPSGEKETFEEYLPEHWDFSSAVNLKGTFLCTQEVAKHMLRNQEDDCGTKGVIITLASIYGVVAPDQRIYFDGMDKALSPSPAVYSATKGGIIAFSKYLAAYYSGKGIRVNCVSPGGVHTNQDERFVKNYSARVPLGRMAQKEEIAKVVAFLASSDASYIHGQNIIVDGGLSCW